MSPERIVGDAVAAGVEGLTLIGGEPFDQAAAAASLASAAQAAGLGVITFTGYMVEELRERDEASRDLIEASDLIVDGPFVADSPEQSRSLVGSTNQRFVHLTDRYSGYDPVSTRDRVEIVLNKDGSIDIAGFLNSSGVAALSAAASAKRSRR
jgi:anaerobic ribonucleoside-triphosphate reductase activating protein